MFKATVFKFCALVDYENCKLLRDKLSLKWDWLRKDRDIISMED